MNGTIGILTKQSNKLNLVHIYIKSEIMIKLKSLLSEKYLGFGRGVGHVKEQSMTDLAQGLDRDPMTGNPMPGGAGGTVNLIMISLFI